MFGIKIGILLDACGIKYTSKQLIELEELIINLIQKNITKHLNQITLNSGELLSTTEDDKINEDNFEVNENSKSDDKISEFQESEFDQNEPIFKAVEDPWNFAPTKTILETAEDNPINEDNFEVNKKCKSEEDNSVFQESEIDKNEQIFEEVEDPWNLAPTETILETTEDNPMNEDDFEVNEKTKDKENVSVSQESDFVKNEPTFEEFEETVLETDEDNPVNEDNFEVTEKTKNKENTSLVQESEFVKNESILEKFEDPFPLNFILTETNLETHEASVKNDHSRLNKNLMEKSSQFERELLGGSEYICWNS